MPFAGTYFLGSKLHKLNDKRGVPTRYEAYKYLMRLNKKKEILSRPIILKTFGQFDIQSQKIKDRLNYDDGKITKKMKLYLKGKTLDYYKYKKPKIKELQPLLSLSGLNMFSKSSKLGIRSDKTVLISLSKKKFYMINFKNETHSIVDETKIPKNNFIKLNLDLRLLNLILKGPKFAHWDNADIGSHIQYQRKPDKYDRQINHVLNFFIAKFMLKQRDSYIRKKFDKEEEWKQINEGQYVVTEINEEDLYKKMFPSKKELQEYYDYRKKWFEQGSKAEPGEKPLSINCELVSTCNLACTMCYTITSKFQNSVIGAQRMLPWKIVKSVIDECAKEKIPSISFSWRGESTLYRDHDENGKLITFPDVLQYARDKEIHEITCLTHGQLIDDDMAQKIVDAEPTWINFSIDGFKENYNKIRTPAKKQNTNYNAFQDVVDAIKRIVKYKKLKNKTRPVIRTNTIYPAVLNDFPKYKEFF